MYRIKNILNKIHADTFQFTDLAIFSLLIAAIMMFTGQILGSVTINNLFYKSITSDMTGFSSITAMYAMFLGMWFVILLYCFLVYKNRPVFKVLWTRPKGNTIKFLLLGLLIGFGMNSICAVVAILNKDISIYYNSFPFVKLLILFIAVFIQSSAEELLCRGFLYQKLRKGYRHPAVAIVLNAAFFAALHLSNPGVSFLPILNIFICGIFFSLIVYYMDSIWCAMAAHAAWNYTQNIIYGLPNSGIVSPFSIFKLDAAAASDSFAYSKDFGLEGTILAFTVMLAGSIVIYLLYSKRNVKPYDPWTE